MRPIELFLAGSLCVASAAGAQCLGDCAADGRVTIDELVVGVRLALGSGAASSCSAFDPDGDGQVVIADLVSAVGHAMRGCPAPSSCASRSGGALITFALCERQTLSVWSTDDAFIDEAVDLLARGEQRIPNFGTLVEGSDCDPQWTWHPAADDMSFADFTIELCDGCPADIEADQPYWFDTVGQYCPWSARVTAVDDRR
jgi:hypothetical protein